jgi:hypothetical protein
MMAGGGDFGGNGFSQGGGYRGRHGGYARSGTAIRLSDSA